MHNKRRAGKKGEFLIGLIMKKYMKKVLFEKVYFLSTIITIR